MRSRVRRTIYQAAILLRLRICGCPSCRACRQIVRREQRRSADRRYEQSQRGKQFDCRRQRKYRHRRVQARVTDQGLRPILSPPRLPGRSLYTSASGLVWLRAWWSGTGGDPPSPGDVSSPADRSESQAQARAPGPVTPRRRLTTRTDQ
jgi:hypothetical protein